MKDIPIPPIYVVKANETLQYDMLKRIFDLIIKKLSNFFFKLYLIGIEFAEKKAGIFLNWNLDINGD